MTISEIINVLIQTLGALLCGMTIVVAVRHLHQWRQDRTRLLPLHVGVIALSYNMLLASLLTRDEGLTWRVAIYGPAIALGVWGMVVMIRYQHRQ